MLVYSLLWSFSGDAKLKMRQDLGDFVRSVTTIALPVANANMPIIDYEVNALHTKVAYNQLRDHFSSVHGIKCLLVQLPTLFVVKNSGLTCLALLREFDRTFSNRTSTSVVSF